MEAAPEEGVMNTEDEFNFIPIQVGLFQEETNDHVEFRRVMPLYFERVETPNGEPSPAHWVSTTVVSNVLIHHEGDFMNT